jgi:hypothetical protein
LPHSGKTDAATAENLAQLPLPAATRWPADQSSAAPLGRTASLQSSITPYVVQRLPNTNPQTSGAIEPPSYTPPVRALPSRGLQNEATSPAPASGSGAASGTIQPPLAEIHRGASTTSNGSGAQAEGHPALPAGQRPRMVNSRTFQIDYAVESAGPWPVHKVELWGTRDGGLHWTSYGVDNDNITPLAATVESEGMYGFRILVQSGNGMIEFPPKSGDRPEIWVGVDLTRPSCRLTQVAQAGGDRLGEIDIRWEAWDRTLAERPITLAYSDQPTGPWLPIASELENTLHYAWKLDSHTPERLYVRLEVRDEAGNVEVTQTTDPVLLERLRAKGRIREVRPGLETSQGPRTYRFF